MEEMVWFCTGPAVGQHFSNSFLKSTNEKKHSGRTRFWKKEKKKHKKGMIQFDSSWWWWWCDEAGSREGCVWKGCVCVWVGVLPFWRLQGGWPVWWPEDWWHRVCRSFYPDTWPLLTLTVQTVHQKNNKIKKSFVTQLKDQFFSSEKWAGFLTKTFVLFFLLFFFKGLSLRLSSTGR